MLQVLQVGDRVIVELAPSVDALTLERCAELEWPRNAALAVQGAKGKVTLARPLAGEQEPAYMVEFDKPVRSWHGWASSPPALHALWFCRHELRKE